MQQLVETVITAVLAGAASAFALLKWLGQKWVSEKFEQRLAAFKHDQQKEIEQLRFKISTLTDRATKLHQREFEVLPEMWSKLSDTFVRTAGIVSPMQSYPDLDRMADDQLAEFLSTSELQQWEKTELETRTEKNDYYAERIFWHRLAEANSLSSDYYMYLQKDGIFIPVEMKEKFYKLGDLMWKALLEHKINRQTGEIPRMSKARDAFDKEGNALLKELENDVQGRLSS